jgi:glycosyltransferase involved in cell wall biosynthesis
MPEITLSYVLTTFNKLTFLKVVLHELIQKRKSDEEIIVIDGGSTDGTREFLNELKNKGEIDFFLSEKDKGESHGFNKGFLLAKGLLIKVVTDDDAFNYTIIQKCRDFMLIHPEIDIMGGNTGSIILENIKTLYWNFSFQDDFELWQKGAINNFFFNGTCLMIRKSSLELTGLFNTRCLLADMEFTLRTTSVAKIAWCTGIISTRILNSQSNNVIYAEKAKIEDEKLCQFYDYKHSDVRKREELKNRSAGKKMRSYLSKIKASFIKKEASEIDTSQSDNRIYSFEEIHGHCIQWMSNHELNKEIRFLSKD